jgi:predicted negative regulator of RcsB-dependent stress response
MAEDKNQVPVAVLEYEPTAFEQQLLKHKSKLILVAVLAVGGTLGYWGWRIFKDSAHNKAGVAFTRANTVEELKKVASEHSGQTAAGSALLLASERLGTDKPAEAVALLRDFLSQHAEHPLRDLAAWRIAEYTAATGDAAAAEKEYEAVAAAGTPFSGFALLRLGDIRWGTGDTEKAKEIYDRILTNPAMSGNPARIAARDRVERALKAKPPALVEYVEPELLPSPKLDVPPPPVPVPVPPPSPPDNPPDSPANTPDPARPNGESPSADPAAPAPAPVADPKESVAKDEKESSNKAVKKTDKDGKDPTNKPQ